MLNAYHICLVPCYKNFLNKGLTYKDLIKYKDFFLESESMKSAANNYLQIIKNFIESAQTEVIDQLKSTIQCTEV